MHPHPLVRGLCAALATAGLLAAAAVAAVPAAAQPAGPTTDLTWGDCPGSSPFRDPRQQCATLTVPMDHRDPDGRQLELAVSRIATADPQLRRGVLLSNPGGPGGSGLDFPSALAQAFPADVLARYDLVGFDPRGVGHSTPLTCGLGPVPLEVVLPYPAPDGTIVQNVQFARTTAPACAEHGGEQVRFTTTANTARDMDLLRAALGEPAISYYGGSYGTYLGAVYTTLFPDRSDRIVLDSGVDPRQVGAENWRSWNHATALRFPDFTRWAAARHDQFGLGRTSALVRQRYFTIAAELDREPLPLPGGDAFTGNTFRETTRSALYNDLNFPLLASLWQDLSGGTGDPAGALRAVRTVAPWATATAAAEVPADNFFAVLWAISCGDVDWPEDVAHYRRTVAFDRRLWPVTNGMPGNIWPCAFWPSEPVEPPVEVTGAGPRNVLVLQHTRDPATPWLSGFGLRTTLADRAAMVTVSAGGHGVYGTGSCADDLTHRFLVDGALPAFDRFCSGPSPDDRTAGRAATGPVLPQAGPLGLPAPPPLTP